MPRHKSSRSRHSSKRSKSKHRARSPYERSRSRYICSSRSRSRESSRSQKRPSSRFHLSRRSPRRTSRDSSSSHRRCSRENLLHLLQEILDHMRRYEVPTSSEVSVDPEGPASPRIGNMTTSLEEPGEVSLPPAVSPEQATDNNRGGEPTIPTLPISVSFSDQAATTGIEESGPEDVRPEAESLALELFGEPAQPSATPLWLPVILAATRSEVRAGLKDELRDTLISKYEPKDELSFLNPPRINKEILPNLNATVITRDKHQAGSQAQVGASLNAFGSGISELSKLECIHSSSEGRVAIAKIADGIRLLVDHHFRLSQTRQAFIVPSLNFLGKSASDSASIDDCLFGSNFAEEINAAQLVERVAQKMARRAPPPPTPRSRPPLQQLKQQHNLPPREAPRKQGNSRPPLHKSSSAHPMKRRLLQPSRSRRSASRSRVGRRR